MDYEAEITKAQEQIAFANQQLTAVQARAVELERYISEQTGVIKFLAAQKEQQAPTQEVKETETSEETEESEEATAETEETIAQE